MEFIKKYVGLGCGYKCSECGHESFDTDQDLYCGFCNSEVGTNDAEKEFKCPSCGKQSNDEPEQVKMPELIYKIAELNLALNADEISQNEWFETMIELLKGRTK